MQKTFPIILVVLGAASLIVLAPVFFMAAICVL